MTRTAFAFAGLTAALLLTGCYPPREEDSASAVDSGATEVTTATTAQAQADAAAVTAQAQADAADATGTGASDAAPAPAGTTPAVPDTGDGVIAPTEPPAPTPPDAPPAL